MRSTWPWSVKWRSGADFVHAAAASARQTEKTIWQRMHLVYIQRHDLDRDIGLQLSGMEGQLLSGRSSRRRRCCRILRGAVSDRRDQLHVLSDADREARRRVGGADAVALQAHAEGAAPDHARQPLEGLRPAGRVVLPGGGHARREARGAAVSASAQLEEGSGRLRRVPRRAAAEGVRRVRVPPRVLARRRGVRAAAAAEPGALHRRQREDVDAGARHGRLRLFPPARRGLHAGRHQALGRHHRARDRVVPRRVRVFQARRGRQGSRACAAPDGAPAEGQARVCARYHTGPGICGENLGRGQGQLQRRRAARPEQRRGREIS